MRAAVLTALLVALTPAAGRAADVTPALHLSAASGVADTSVRFVGSHFPASDSLALTLAGVTLGTTTTDPRGSFVFAAKVPATAPHGDQLATATDNVTATATASFVVLAPLRGRVVNIKFRSRNLHGTLGVAVYLPPGYATSGLAYPTLYFLHSLPSSARAYSAFAPHVSSLLDLLATPVIAVFPQGARDRDTDPEYNNWGPGRDWERAISVELPRVIDSRFRTLRDRRARAIVGNSAGGYGAAICGLHHLSTFSVIESWSGYFRATDPSGEHVLDRGTPDANDAASAFAVVPKLLSAFAKTPTYFAFYVGAGDRLFRADNETLHAQLTAAGVAHEFDLYPGGHTWLLWDVHAEAWLGAALGRLLPAAPATSHA